MDHCPPTEQLQAMLADALTDPAAAAIEAHATSCPRCQEVLEQLAASPSDRNLPRPAPPEPATGPYVKQGDDEAFLRKLQQAPPWSPPPPKPQADRRLPDPP